MSHRVGISTGFALLLAVSALGCAEAETAAEQADRTPIGKADAVGSCAREDGEGDLCGGRSEGNCWCDDQCEMYGDCCGDKVAICDGLDLDVAAIDSAGQFDAMSFSGQGGVIIGKSVKFVIDARGPTPSIHYLNANYDGPVSNDDATKFHYYFAREALDVPEDAARFNDVTYWTNDKRYYAGTLQEYRLGEDQPPVYGIQFYPQDAIAEQSVLTAARAVAQTVDIEGARLAFVAMGQQQTTDTVADDLTSLGVESLTLDNVLGSLDYIPMQVGEAWGFLRIFPQDHDLLSALDIPVFDELPLDLTVVAGTITRSVQDASSHINLKSKERGTPNMVLRSSGPDHAVLSPFADRPVHLVVSPDGFTIEPSTEEEVREKLAERLDRPWQTLDIDPEATITSYDDMCPSGAPACLGTADEWGGKAGNLGFLRHPDVLGRPTDAGSFAAELGYEVAPAGVGVPVQMYFDFVDHNPDLKEAVESFIAEEKAMTLSVAERVAALEEIQAMFMEAEMPPGMAEEIQAAAVAALPEGTANLKIRSSANAEDIPGFDGAGLYDSFRVKLSSAPEPCRRFEENGKLKIRPRTTECVVKGVYASLWNKRAVEERSFARVDHETAGMGLAIVQRYKERGDIGANSVVVTRVLNSSGVYGYSFSNQQDNNVVTNPAPGTHSESVIAAFLPNVDTSFTVTRFAKPEPELPALQDTVMTSPQMQTMLDISQAVERAYCRANPEYYPGSCDQVLYDPDKPTALDMEFKLYETGEFLCKQVREFAGS